MININTMIPMPDSAHGFGLPTSVAMRGTGASTAVSLAPATAIKQTPATAHARGRVWADNRSVQGTHAWRDPIG